MKNRLILIILLISYSEVISICQIQWPVSPTNQQGNITGTVGEFRPFNTNHFHMGLDITSNTSTNVYAINSGIATLAGTGTNARIYIGNDAYWHVDPAGVVQAAISNGQVANVQAGDWIGIMVNQPPNTHLHLQNNNTNYLAQNLSPFTDLAFPYFSTNFLPNGVQFYRNPIIYTTPIANLPNMVLNQQININSIDYTLLYNKIDIAVHAIEPKTNSNGTSRGGQCAPNRIEWVLRNSSNQDVITNDDFDFTSEPVVGASNICFHPQSAGIANPTIHIITSSPSQTPYDRYFNSGLRTNTTETWPNPVSTTLDAHCSEDAEYNDGKYQMIIRASDVSLALNPQNITPDNNNTSTHLPEELSRIVNILVDNFRPYIQKVEIWDAATGGNKIYSRVWTWNGSALTLGAAPTSPICNDDKDIWVHVFTSEPMTDVTLTAFGTTYNSSTPVVNSNNKEWVFAVPASVTTSGTQILSIGGHDLATNPLEGFNTASNITSFPIHQSDGTWNPTPIPQNDVVHKFEMNQAITPIPTNVIASSSYTNKIIIAWNSVSGASCYNVYKSNTNDVSTATSASGWVNSNNYIDNSATGTTYYWVRAAANATGLKASGYSEPVVGTLAGISVADFSMVQKSFHSYPNDIEITDKSSGDIKEWLYEYITIYQTINKRFTSPPGTFTWALGIYNGLADEDGILKVTITDIYNNKYSASKYLNIQLSDKSKIVHVPSFSAINEYTYEFSVSAFSSEPTYSIFKITLQFGDGTTQEVKSGDVVRHTYSVPVKNTTLSPSYTIWYYWNGPNWESFTRYFGDIYLHPDYKLNISITTGNLVIGKQATLTAKANNCSGGIYWVWQIDKSPNQTDYYPGSTIEIAERTSGNTSSINYSFDQEGTYTVRLNVNADNGFSGFPVYKFPVSLNSDPKIGVSFASTDLNNNSLRDEFPLNSLIQLPIYAYTDGVQWHPGEYHGVAKVDFDVYDASVSPYKLIGTPSPTIYNNTLEQYNSDPYTPYNKYYVNFGFSPCLNYFNKEGEYEIRSNVYAGYFDFTDGAPAAPLICTTNYSTAKKKIKIVDCNKQTVIKDVASWLALVSSKYIETGSFYTESSSSPIYTLNSGEKLTIKARKEIILKPGVTLARGSSCIATSIGCPPIPSSSCQKSAEAYDLGNNLVIKMKNGGAKIYPNPTKDKFIVELPQDTLPTQLILLNSLGTKIDQKIVIENLSYVFDLTRYPVGVYILRINYARKVEVFKIIKN